VIRIADQPPGTRRGCLKRVRMYLTCQLAPDAIP
jgi:hypothetical protein